MTTESTTLKYGPECSPDASGQHRNVPITINGKSFQVEKGPFTVKHLKQLAGIPAEDILARQHHGKLHDLRNEESLSVDCGDEFVSHPAEHEHQVVKIVINGDDHKIRRGRHSVPELRSVGKVPEGEILSIFKDGAFVDLADNASVTITGCEVFASHRPTGGSS